MTKGDFYLTDYRGNNRTYFQHFTIMHDATFDFFINVLKESYLYTKENKYNIENYICYLHSDILEANNDRNGGFFIILDLTLNYIEIGYKYCHKKELYFKGDLDSFLSSEIKKLKAIQ